MEFSTVFLWAFVVILSLMIILWVVSIFLRNVSIVDIFWGFGFVLASVVYLYGSGDSGRKWLVFALVAVWGLRLTFHIARRNVGKGEDFRYREFRRNYGAHRYWWISFFQTFLLQGILMWVISLPLLASMYYGAGKNFYWLDVVGIVIWLAGFIFEAGGDWQLSRFRKDPGNKGKVLDDGFWKYTRHPNYFGDAVVWWAFGIFTLAAGAYWQVIGSVVMTLLLMRVSGVTLLEKTLVETKPGYREYMRKTSSFFPRPPKNEADGMGSK